MMEIFFVMPEKRLLSEKRESEKKKHSKYFLRLEYTFTAQEYDAKYLTFRNEKKLKITVS